jgi:hypothetical protein
MGKETLAKMGEIAVGVTSRGDPLVHLNDMKRGPRHLLMGQLSEHLPRRLASADRHNKSAPGGNGLAGFRSNE